jgi:hypothetical protein
MDLVVGAVTFSMREFMRRRRQKPRARARLLVRQRALIGDDDPLFDDRELEFAGGGEDKVKQMND